MAVTDKSKGAKGISAFVLERGMGGLVAGKKEDKLGMRASETTEVILQNCRVAPSQLIGEEGQGFIQTLQVLDAGRIGIAALSVGLAQGAFDALKQRIQPERYGGAPLLGVRGAVFKAHGSSNREAIMNAIRICHEMVATELNQHVMHDIARANELIAHPV